MQAQPAGQTPVGTHVPTNADIAQFVEEDIRNNTSDRIMAVVSKSHYYRDDLCCI